MIKQRKSTKESIEDILFYHNSYLPEKFRDKYNANITIPKLEKLMIDYAVEFARGCARGLGTWHDKYQGKGLLRAIITKKARELRNANKL